MENKDQHRNSVAEPAADLRTVGEVGHADQHPHSTIHFTVDGERVETDKREMTPNQIIREFGSNQDPATHYLVRIEGHRRISYKGKGDEPIKLHNGMQFQIISTGPTPVSDGPFRSGIDVFLNGLRQLGFVPEQLPGRPDHVVFDYLVPGGRFEGQQIRLGFVVPSDFPITPPSGPHMSPHILPINPNSGPHPLGSIHTSHAQPFAEALKGAWQYWSRPYSEWAISKKTVAAYMSHIWRLWDTQ